MEKALESLKQLPQGHKKQHFDFSGQIKIVLGDKRLKLKAVSGKIILLLLSTMLFSKSLFIASYYAIYCKPPTLCS